MTFNDFNIGSFFAILMVGSYFGLDLLNSNFSFFSSISFISSDWIESKELSRLACLDALLTNFLNLTSFKPDDSLDNLDTDKLSTD